MRNSRSTILPVAGCAVALTVLVAVGFTLLGTDDSTPEAEPDTPFAGYTVDTDSADPQPEPDPRPSEQPDEPATADDAGEAAEPADPDDLDLAAPPPPETDTTTPTDSDPDETAPADTPAPRPGAGDGYEGPTGRLIVITNFARAEVEVNGETYPAYSDDLQNRGIELPAYEPHLVIVEYDGNERIYEIELNPGERRMLMVELTGMDDRSGSDRGRDQRRRRGGGDDEVDDDKGRLTVYARPRGEIYIDDEETGERAPTTLDIDPGRHQVQVEYEDGQMSETKNVRVREGSRVKLFFRQDEE